MKRFQLASTVGILVLTLTHGAAASPAANPCSKLATVVDNAKSVVVAHARSVTSSSQNTTTYVRVTYAVDEVLYGPKVAEVVVEETCDTRPMPVEQAGYPAVTGYCSNSVYHALPGLKDDGTVAPGQAALMLSDVKSGLDAKPVWHFDREDPWGPCPDEPSLTSKRPALKDLLSKVRALDGKTTSGFPRAVGAASPPASAAVPDAGTPAPALASARPNQKSGGCNAASITKSPTETHAGLVSVLALVGIALLRRRT